MVHIFPGGKALLLGEFRHPQMVLHEIRPDSGRRSGAEEGGEGRFRHQLIADRLAGMVQLVGVDHFPVALGRRIGGAAGLQLGLQHRILLVEGVAVGVLGLVLLRIAVAFDNGIARPVHRHLQPGAESVLMDMALQAGGHFNPVFGGLAGQASGGVDDAGGLHLEGDLAGLVEIPVEGIFVIADGADRGDHQLAATPDLGAFGTEIPMFPEDAVILLMDADGLLDLENAAFHGVQLGIQIGDMAQAVAAQLQRVGQLAQPIFADIKHILAEMPALRHAVGHHHLGDGGSGHDRPAVIGDVVQGQPLAGVEADHAAPFIPADFAVLEHEAGPFRLDDVQRLQGGAEILAELRLVIEFRHRDRQHAVIIDADHLARLDIDHGVDALDRVGVEILVLIQAQPAECVGKIAAFLALYAEIPGRPRVDADLAHIGDAALGAGGDEIWMGADDILDLDELFELDHRPCVRMEALCGDEIVGQGQAQAPDARRIGQEDIGAGLARAGLAGAVGGQGSGAGLLQLDHLEQIIRPECRIGADDRHHMLDFGGVQRGERVAGAVPQSRRGRGWQMQIVHRHTPGFGQFCRPEGRWLFDARSRDEDAGGALDIWCQNRCSQQGC